MKILIKFIKEDVLSELKNNKTILYNEVVKNGKNSLEEVFHRNYIVFDTRIPGEDFELDMSAVKPEHTDLENVKRVHKYMSALTESQASDERIWAAYTLSVFADYMKYRWNPDSEITMMNRYFFSYSPKRSLFRNGISRLWWIGRLTYDSSAQNKFELTEFMCKKQDNIGNLLDINFANNPDILRAATRSLIDAEKNGINIDRDMVRKVSEYINTLGGAYLIDSFDYDKAYNKVQEFINKTAK